MFDVCQHNFPLNTTSNIFSWPMAALSMISASLVTRLIVCAGAGHWMSLVAALLAFAPLAQLAQLHQAAHDLTQLHPAAVPPKHLS